ncbi:MAG: nuclear transport factor 2 family protein [Deltaproteobacteria bacterium]|nr:nuclear transport factor 2 family protein [Deltaproteobacteria bacterium]
MTAPIPARTPEDLTRLFLERANAADIEGLLALYEPDAVLDRGDGTLAVGTAAIRQFFTEILADRPHFTPGETAPVLRAGDLALTSTRLDDGSTTAEVARRQPDGTWRFAIDQPTIARGA